MENLEEAKIDVEMNQRGSILSLSWKRGNFDKINDLEGEWRKTKTCALIKGESERGTQTSLDIKFKKNKIRGGVGSMWDSNPWVWRPLTKPRVKIWGDSSM